MSVFSSKFRHISKKATAWSLAALTAVAGIGAMPGVLGTEVKAAGTLSNTDRGVLFANSRTDFRDESIYFLITTRFYDGDPSNNARKSEDKKAQNPENDPSWRGDFKGLIDKLDYIKALGFTAIWITPVVENDSGYDYHGYHAYDFSAVDKRYESNGVTYQTLIDACHAKGIKVIQDVVFNHSCNWGEKNLLKLESDVFTERNSVVMNGKYGPGGQYTDTENIYHHNAYCGGGDWDNFEAQRKTIADDCLDLNTENPKVYNYLVDCYNNYINMGVDGFRVDTVKHISRLTLNAAFIPEFKKTGGDNFYMFGEICTKGHDVWYRDAPPISCAFYTWADDSTWLGKWSTDQAANNDLVEAHYNAHLDTGSQPTSDNAFLKGNEYHTPDYSKRSGLDAIDFQMHWSFINANSAFNTALGEDKYFNDSTWNVVYVDSHDYGPDECQTLRYNGGTDAWAENLSLMFTFRGIPCVYYGSEIEFQAGKAIDVGPNQPLANTGRAYYGDNIEGDISTTGFTVISAESGAVKDTLDKPLSQHIMRLNRIRQSVPALRKGQYSTEGCSGNIAFKRRYTDSSTDSFACVAISGDATFSGIPNGTYVDAVTGDTQTVSGGTLTAKVSGKGNMKVYVLSTSKTPAPGRVIKNGTYLNDGGSAELIGIEEGGDVVDTIEVNSITLDKPSVTVKTNESVKVTATIDPVNATNKTVKWTSSNESVAKVSNGTITGVAKGSATITATTNNGKTATVNVTVEQGTVTVIQPTGVTLSPTSLSIDKGKTGTLTATVAPSNATDKTVTWTSSNASVAKVSNGTVTGVAAGTATITATTSNGKTATATVTVKDVSGGDGPTTYIDNGVYFKKPTGWGSTINIYAYSGASSEIAGKWPGTAMKDVGNGYYAYEFTSTATDTKVIFNDGSNQVPGSQQPGFAFQNKGLYTSDGFVKVIEPVQSVEVTSVSVSPTSASIKVGATKAFTATVSPSNATDQSITWSSSNTSVATVSNGTVKGIKAGTATITAKTSNGKTATATITVTSSTPLTNNSKISSTTVTLGKSITLTGAASGGTSPYTYAYYYKKSSQSSWTTVKDFSSTTSVSITPASATTYDVCIKVKDKTGTVEKKYFKLTMAPASLTMKISATTINLGESVTASVSGSNLSGYKFAYYYKQTSQSSWTTAKDFSTTKSVAITPKKATTYEICIKAKDSTGAITKKYFNVSVVQGLTNTSTVSANKINLGKTVTVTASGTGGTGYYQFAVYYKKKSESTWTKVQDFGANETIKITPKTATQYDICAKVKDSNGDIAKKYFVVEVVEAPLTNTSTISATTIKVGNSITAKGSATGGTAPYKYAYYYKQRSQSTWTIAKDFSTTTSVSIKPAKVTTYDVCIKVKDAKDTVEKLYFVVTVKSTVTNNSTVSATSVTKGNTVTVKFAATGGTSPYTYKVDRMLVGSADGWTSISNTSTTSKAVKIPTADTYKIRVTATDSKGMSDVKYFTVTGK